MPASERIADLPSGSVTLLTIPAGTGVVNYLPESAFQNLLVVAAGPTPRDIERTVRDRNGDPSTVGVVPVSGTDVSTDIAMWTARRVDPSDLTGISIETSRGMQYVKPGTGWVVVDSASVLSMYAQPARLARLLSSIGEAARAGDARCVIGATASVLDDDISARLQGIVDDRIDLD